MEGQPERSGGPSPPLSEPSSPPLSSGLDVHTASDVGAVAEISADGGGSAERAYPELELEPQPVEASPMPVSPGENLILPRFPNGEEVKEVCAEVADSGGLTVADASSVPADITQKIVRQVEYYFSDENLPTDKFLLKYVKKNKQGYVPIAVIASFRKMKKLVQGNDALIAAALRTSSHLVVSKDGKSVKRLLPLPPPPEAEDKRPLTVVVENLPEDCSEETLRKTFGVSGQIQRISIRDPNSTERSGGPEEDPRISGKLHALVEYETPAAAEHAAATLNDQKNWRSGMRVELLLKRLERFGLVARARKPDGPAAGESGSGSGPGPGPDGPAEAAGLEVQPGRRKQRGKSGPRSQPLGPSKLPPVGPRMPDGTRGFSMGRGKPLPPGPP